MSVPLFGVLLERHLHTRSAVIELVFRQKGLKRVGFDYFTVSLESDPSSGIAGLVEIFARDPNQLRAAVASGDVVQLEPGQPIEIGKPYWALFFIRSAYHVLANLQPFGAEAVEIQYERSGPDMENGRWDAIGSGEHRLHLRDMSAVVGSGMLRRMWASGVGSAGLILDFSCQEEKVYGDPSVRDEDYRPALQFEVKCLSADQNNPVINDALLEIGIIWNLTEAVPEEIFRTWAVQQFDFNYLGRGSGDVPRVTEFYWHPLNPKLVFKLSISHPNVRFYYRRQSLHGKQVSDPDIVLTMSVLGAAKRPRTKEDDIGTLNTALHYFVSTQRSRSMPVDRCSLVFDFGTSTVAFAYINPAEPDRNDAYEPLLGYIADLDYVENEIEQPLFDKRMIDGVLARSQIILEVDLHRMDTGPVAIHEQASGDGHNGIGYLNYARQFFRGLTRDDWRYIADERMEGLLASSFLAASILKQVRSTETENYKLLRSSKTSVARSAALNLVFGEKNYRTRVISEVRLNFDPNGPLSTMEIDETSHLNKKAFLVSAIYQFLSGRIFVEDLSGGRIVLTHPASMSQSVNEAYAQAAEAIWLTQAARFGLLTGREQRRRGIKNDTITEARAVLSVLAELLEWNGQSRLISVLDVGAGTFDASSFSLTQPGPGATAENDPFECITLIAQATGLAGDAFRDALLDDFTAEIAARGLVGLFGTEFFKGGDILEGPYAGLSVRQAVIEAVIGNPAAWYMESAESIADTDIEDLSGEGEIPLSIPAGVWLRIPMAGGPDTIGRFEARAPSQPPTLDDPLQLDVFDLGGGIQTQGVWFKVTGTHERNARSMPVAPRTQLLLRAASEMAVHGIMTAALRRIPSDAQQAGPSARRPIEHVIILSGRGALNPMLRRIVGDTVKSTLAVTMPQRGGPPIKTRMGSIAAFIKARVPRNNVVERWVRQVAGGTMTPDWTDPRFIGLLMKTAVVIGGGLPLALRTSGGDGSWEIADFGQYILLGLSPAGKWSLRRLDEARSVNAQPIEFTGPVIEALRPIPPMLHRLDEHPRLSRSTWVPVDEDLLGHLLGDLMGCSVEEGLDILRSCSTASGEVRAVSSVKWTVTQHYRVDRGRSRPVVVVSAPEAPNDIEWLLS